DGRDPRRNEHRPAAGPGKIPLEETAIVALEDDPLALAHPATERERGLEWVAPELDGPLHVYDRNLQEQRSRSRLHGEHLREPLRPVGIDQLDEVITLSQALQMKGAGFWERVLGLRLEGRQLDHIEAPRTASGSRGWLDGHFKRIGRLKHEEPRQR